MSIRTVLALLVALPALAAAPRKIIGIDGARPNLLKDERWAAYGSGFARDGEAFVCDNAAGVDRQAGLHQSLDLNQTEPLPIVASAASRAENVGGSADPEYSLYLDLIFADGTHLWGQSAAFTTGTHDWQTRTVRILPERPIKRLEFYVLLRRHSGKASFREMRLQQIDIPAGAGLFDGQPVLPDTPREGFLVRDVAAGSDFVPFEDNQALGIRIEPQSDRQKDAVLHRVKVTDTTGRDRALTLIYTHPLDDRPWQYFGSARNSVPAKAPREYHPQLYQGRLAVFPLVAVGDGKSGSAIALDLARPAVFRVGYAAATRELYIAFDIALTPEKLSAELACCTFDFDAAWQLRSALARYHELYPELFRTRIEKQGVWMPFAKISAVQDWQDFGFRFKEGNDEPAWDAVHDILTFRYTEPMTWWMKMPRDMPRTLDAALAYAKTLADKGDANAKAFLTSGHHDEAGRFVARIRNDPWCDGAVWSMNSAPNIAGDNTDFRNKWNADLRKKLYEGRNPLAGEYVDSSEGYVTDVYDFRRDHFAAMATPLTFSPDTHRPAIFRGLIAFEYVRALADDLHPRGRFTMANGTPDHLCWLAGQLDVLGTETDWNPANKWRPMSDTELMYRRMLCAAKPYCFLMNTRFEQFPSPLVEKYMKRSLAYGMFPGFFSHNAADGAYFTRPDLYNRDRPLFRKYIPLCRLVAEAGWQPVPLARSSDEHVYVERFGRIYLTVFNDSTESRKVTITLAGLAPSGTNDLVSGQAIVWDKNTATLQLDAEDVAVMEVK
ncbi:MAG: hypothetical protein ACHRHE_11490 [Tepidisphaerales bacterium]